jgi:hypothetical protein
VLKKIELCDGEEDDDLAEPATGDLPRLTTRAVDPHFVLQGIAAGRVVLLERGQADVPEAGGRRSDVVGGLDLDAKVVQPGVLTALALDQDEIERRLGDGEVRIAGPTLGRRGAEQLRVEGDRAFEVGNTQGELNTGHGSLLRECQRFGLAVADAGDSAVGDLRAGPALDLLAQWDVLS